MRIAPKPSTRANAVALASTAACSVVAMTALPRSMVPFGWLLAFVVPGALLGALPALAARPVRRAALGIVLQGTAFVAALQWQGPLAHPAALACTILPPLAFATVRGTAADRALALFLGFCVLLVGSILAPPGRGTLLAYAIAGCAALRSASHTAAASIGVRSRARGQTPLHDGATAAFGTLCLGVLLAGVAVQRTLEWLPTPGRLSQKSPASASQARARTAGLDDSFELSGRGLLAGLGATVLAQVYAEDGEPLPNDLYLRSGFFAQAGLDRWERGPVDVERFAGAGVELQPLRPATTSRSLLVERRAGGNQFVFTTPGTCSVLGLVDLDVDRARQHVRPSARSGDGPYRLLHQEPALPDRTTPVRTLAADAWLVDLPRLDRARWNALLEQWGVGDEPVAAMEAIAAGLARHCTYDRLARPSGPFGSELENFLFADGQQRGYCMHFASVAALLLRMRGVPARIGVGLHGGDVLEGDRSTRSFGGKHAHAWVEVPFEGLGYVVFDPTPPSERANPMPARVDERLDDTPTATLLEAWLERLRALLGEPWLPPLLLVLAVALALRPRRTHAEKPHGAPVSSPVRRARRLLARLLKELAAHGHRRQRGATLEQFLRTIGRPAVELTPVHAAIVAYQDVRFGGLAFDVVREQRLLEALATVGTWTLANDAAGSPRS